MGRPVLWDERAWDLLMAMPERIRAEALYAVTALTDGPLPTDKPYGHVPDTYRIDTAHVSVWYRVVGDEIDVVYLRANS